jgi:hypothetical protein
VAAEEYADYGPLHSFYGRRDQSHQVFGAVDYNRAGLSIEAGVGAGLTSASDPLTFKVIASRDLAFKRKH